MAEETFREYGEFVKSLVIEELIKEFDFNCELEFIGTKRYGASKVTTYYFKDNVLGITWERDVTDREYFDIACRNPKMRARRVEQYAYTLDKI